MRRSGSTYCTGWSGSVLNGRLPPHTPLFILAALVTHSHSYFLCSYAHIYIIFVVHRKRCPCFSPVRFACSGPSLILALEKEILFLVQQTSPAWSLVYFLWRNNASCIYVNAVQFWCLKVKEETKMTFLKRMRGKYQASRIKQVNANVWVFRFWNHIWWLTHLAGHHTCPSVVQSEQFHLWEQCCCEDTPHCNENSHRMFLCVTQTSKNPKEMQTHFPSHPDIRRRKKTPVSF